MNPAEQGQERENWDIGKRKGKWRTREKGGETGGIREKKERCRNQRGGRMWGADEVEGGSNDRRG